VIKLLRPQHAGKSLAHDVFGIVRKILGNNRGIKLIRLALTNGEEAVETVEGGLRSLREINVSKSQTNGDGLPGGNLELVMRRGFRAFALGIYRASITVDNIVGDAVFHIRLSVGDSVQPLVVGLVFCEQQLRGALAYQPALAQSRVIQLDRSCAVIGNFSQLWTLLATSPRPCISEPHSR